MPGKTESSSACNFVFYETKSQVFLFFIYEMN